MDSVAGKPPMGFSFGDFFGEDDSTLSMEKVERFLDRMVQAAAEEAQVSPHQLVRIVKDSQITWMTQKQAVDYLQKGQSASMQQEVEHALKGDLKFIRQELEVLLALVTYTFDRCKSHNEVTAEDVLRIESNLRRRRVEIHSGVAQTAECELRMHESRRRNPLLDEYEELMGEFLNLQSRGNDLTSPEKTRSWEIAKILAQNKKKYLLLARSLEPDVRTVYYQRLNLQRTKKRILGTQKELLTSKSQMLTLEIHSLIAQLSEIRTEVGQAEENGQTQAQLSIRKDLVYGYSNETDPIQQKSVQLDLLHVEIEAVSRQEAAADGVIQHISENVLQETEIKVDVKDMHRSAPKPAGAAPKPGEPPKPRSGGMHISKNR